MSREELELRAVTRAWREADDARCVLQRTARHDVRSGWSWHCWRFGQALDVALAEELRA